MKRIILFSMLLMSLRTLCFGSGADPFVTRNYVKGGFPLTVNGKAAAIRIDSKDWPGVTLAAKNLQADLEKVTGTRPVFSTDQRPGMAVIIGTIGKSALIDDIIRRHKIDAGGIAGKWESTLIEVVKNPLPGIDSALVIAGSDKRGTIYGIYELSSQIGVSPWYYWADVPVKKSNTLFVSPGRHVISSPAVKYRGIFLNDEAPALSGWSRKEFGGFNSKFYTKVFELILRLKGNYLWPAMWGNAFNDDDKMNPVLADEYGVVIGTSHHEPLSRAHDEWKRYKGGKWNYEQNPEQLRAFWESGLKRVADKEQIITVGMRGDGDEPMTDGTATALLENIVKDQRNIIEKVTKKPAEETPQLWALYKEVQAYYDQGMKVPDDITLLLCDDNWGNIRKLPKLAEAPRKGGYGIYYHFDYVGDPRNYKWINTNPIQKVWEQMNLAYAYDANEIWIVNVGDLKPMEFPISFFLEYAWSPAAMPAEKLKQYMVDWCRNQFGESDAVETADILDLYSKYNGRIKPELLNQNTYSLINYREFETVTADYKKLEERAKSIYNKMPAGQKDAYYQLILHPVEASANLYQMYEQVARNKLYVKQGRFAGNALADTVALLFKRDQEISRYYNKTLAGGKWDHMMDQTHISYTYWQQPEQDTIPDTDILTVTDSFDKAVMGLAIEGSDSSWTGKGNTSAALPAFDYYSSAKQYIEIFNKGKGTFSYSLKAPAFIRASTLKGQINDQERIFLEIDWTKAPQGKSSSSVILSGSEGSKITVPLRLDNRRFQDKMITAFVPANGVISMEAPNYTKAVGRRPVQWMTLPGYGKTLGGVMPVPVTSPVQQLDAQTPHLEYTIYVQDPGEFKLNTFISPTIDFTNTDGLKFAVSVDDQAPVIVNISADYRTEKAWRQSVADNIKIFKTALKFEQPGRHTLKYWMISPGVVLQKLVLDLGGLKPSFLGPPETFITRTP
jgi:hypothetical protein